MYLDQIKPQTQNQQRLLRQVKKLLNDKRKLNEQINSINNEKRRELDEKQRLYVEKLDEANKFYNQYMRTSKELGILKMQIKSVQRLKEQVNTQKNMINTLNDLLKKEKRKYDELYAKRSQIDSKYMKSHANRRVVQIHGQDAKKIVQLFPTSATNQANSDQIRLQRQKAIRQYKQFFQNNYEKREKQLSKENSKLRDWLKRILNSIQSILNVKLKKLRQNTENQASKFIEYKYLQKMHLTNIHYLDKEQFPYCQMLQDFEKIVKQADMYKAQMDKLLIVNQEKYLEREMIDKIIESLRRYNSYILKEFSTYNQKKKELAQEYTNVLHYEQSSVQYVNKVNVKELESFLLHPERILNQFKLQFDQFMSQKPRMIEKFHSKFPLFQLQKQKFLNQKKQSINPNQAQQRLQIKQAHIQNNRKQQQIQIKRRNSEYLLTDLESPQDKRIRQNKQLLVQATNYVNSFIQNAVKVKDQKDKIKQLFANGHNPEQIQRQYPQHLARREQAFNRNRQNESNNSFNSSNHVSQRNALNSQNMFMKQNPNRQNDNGVQNNTINNSNNYIQHNQIHSQFKVNPNNTNQRGQSQIKNNPFSNQNTNQIHQNTNQKNQIHNRSNQNNFNQQKDHQI